MTILLAPYHQDERLSDRNFPAHADVTVTAELDRADKWHCLAKLYDRVADEVARLADEETPTVLSGDCLMSIGVLTGLQRAGIDPSIVWFDAHGDLHTMESSTSGYLGGMALRFLLGANPDRVADRLGLRAVDEARAVLVDGRDLDPAEVDYLATSPVRRVAVDQVAQALPDGPLLLHVDLDVIDKTELPGLLYPVPDGPTTASVVSAIRAVLDSGRVTAFTLACTWHPPANGENAVRQRLLAQLTS